MSLSQQKTIRLLSTWIKASPYMNVYAPIMPVSPDQVKVWQFLNHLNQHRTNTKPILVYNQSIYNTVWIHCPHLHQSSVKGASVYKEIPKHLALLSKSYDAAGALRSCMHVGRTEWVLVTASCTQKTSELLKDAYNVRKANKYELKLKYMCSQISHNYSLSFVDTMHSLVLFNWLLNPLRCPISGHHN